MSTERQEDCTAPVVGASVLDVRCVVAERGIDVALDLPAGTTLALVGPNGAGKSTLLWAVAGLLAPDNGHVRAGTTWFDSAAGVDLMPHERRAALLLQQPTLFPHLSALDNVAFGPRATGLRRGPARKRAAEWLARVGADQLADRRPHQLSGGQAARVAIARALAADPAVVLLDEPLAALDVDSAVEVRELLADVLAERTSVLVTHAVRDVATLADEVAVMESGRLVERASRADFLRGPTSAFGAALVGG